MGSILIYERPELRSPYMVIGFEGWADAARASTGVVGYLRDKLEARKFAEMNPDDFYLFQLPGVEAVRPITVVEDGYIRELEMPYTRFWAWRNERSARDLIIMRGAEPHLRWNQYIDSVLDLAQEFKVQRVYAIGGTYDRIPHTAGPVVSAVCNQPALRAELMECGIGMTGYSGPTAIHTMLMAAAEKRGLEIASLWGHAPHYIQVPNAKVCCGLLERLMRMLGLELDLQDLKKAGEYLDEQVNRAIEQKAELREYVARLEDEYTGRAYGTWEPLGDDIVREVEDFLRERHEDEE